jgi:hypothetical protein
MSNNASKYERQNVFPLPDPSALLLEDSAGRIARELWSTYYFSPVDIIPPWFSMLM